MGVAALALWLTCAEGEGWAVVAVISLTSFLAGTGLALGAAAMNSLVPSLVTREEMPLAMTLNTAPITVARVAGPVLGAWLLASHGPVAALWAATAGHLVFALAVAAARPDAGPNLPRTPEGAIGTAWRYARREDRVLLRLLVAVGLVSFAVEPAFVLAPSYVDLLGGGTTDVGLLSASFGVGAAVGLAIGVAVGGRVALPSVAVLSLGSVVVAGVGSPVAPGFALAHLSFGLLGVGFTVAMGALGTLVQLRVPADLRGRVMAFWILALVGVRPAVSLLAGAVSDSVGDRWAFGLVAGLVALALLWLRPSRLA